MTTSKEEYVPCLPMRILGYAIAGIITATILAPMFVIAAAAAFPEITLYYLYLYFK